MLGIEERLDILAHENFNMLGMELLNCVKESATFSCLTASGYDVRIQSKDGEIIFSLIESETDDNI